MRSNKSHHLLRHLVNGTQHPISKTPLTNLIKGEKAYTLELAAPGMEKKDFDISLDEHNITISTESNQETAESTKLKRQEYDYSTFTKNVRLPEDIKRSEIKASYKSGVLSIILPIDTTLAEAKHITVS